MKNRTVLTDDEKTTVANFIKKITHKCIASIEDIETPKAELSEKAQKIKDVIETGDFGCRQDAVAKLMSILLDERIDCFDEDEDPVDELEGLKGFCAVCFGGTIGVLSSYCEAAGAFQIMEDGNCEETDEYARRFATDNEIDKWVEDYLNNKNINHFHFLFV